MSVIYVQYYHIPCRLTMKHGHETKEWGSCDNVQHFVICDIEAGDRVDQVHLHQFPIGLNTVTIGLQFITTKISCPVIGEVTRIVVEVTGHQLLSLELREEVSSSGVNILQYVILLFDFGCNATATFN